MKFENKIKKVEKLVSKLESNEESLEDQLKYYEEAMILANECRNFLQKAEQKVIDISENNSK